MKLLIGLVASLFAIPALAGNAQIVKSTVNHTLECAVDDEGVLPGYQCDLSEVKSVAEAHAVKAGGVLVNYKLLNAPHGDAPSHDLKIEVFYAK